VIGGGESQSAQMTADSRIQQVSGLVEALGREPKNRRVD
jgi:hypothetical protein